MIKVLLNVVAAQKVEVSRCPYCDGEPIVIVDIETKPFASTRVTHQTVECPYCGTSASLDIWEKICNQFAEPLCKVDSEGGQ